MGRKAKTNIKTNVMLEEDIYDALRFLLADPRNGRLRYGALGAIINNLLKQFITKCNDPSIDTVQFLRAYGVDISPDTEVEPEDETQPEAEAETQMENLI